MDRIHSRMTEIEAELAEMRRTISSTANNNRDQDNDSGRADAPRPSKASLLVRPGGEQVNGPYLDSRFSEDRWIPGKSPLWEFSPDYIRYAIDTRGSPQTDISMHLLRHERAEECPVQENCSHWQYVRNGQPRQEEGVVELRVLCIKEAHADDSLSYYKGTPMLFDVQQSIICRPCRLSNALRPNFSGFRELEGHFVVAWRLVEEEMSDEKWLDQYGRLVAHMG